MRPLRNPRFITMLAAIMTSCFFLYTATFGVFNMIIQRGTLLMAAVILVFLSEPFCNKRGSRICRIVDLVLILGTLIAFGYTLTRFARNSLPFRDE
jgi:TRAP-type uncharacterized transport system fused permease subunit